MREKILVISIVYCITKTKRNGKLLTEKENKNVRKMLTVAYCKRDKHGKRDEMKNKVMNEDKI